MLRKFLSSLAQDYPQQFIIFLQNPIHLYLIAPITVEQQAFMHSLQLYDMKSLMRLVANYDATKGLKVVLPGIEKSYRSLMVIQKLEQFTNNSRESTSLDAYKSRLEEALSRVLKCRREDLYEEDVLAEKNGCGFRGSRGAPEQIFYGTSANVIFIKLSCIPNA